MGCRTVSGSASSGTADAKASFAGRSADDSVIPVVAVVSRVADSSLWMDGTIADENWLAELGLRRDAEVAVDRHARRGP